MASKFYTVMVVGNNPDELMKPYDMALKVEPYIKYRYLDSDKLRENAIKTTQGIVDNAQLLKLSKFQVDYFKEKLKGYSGMSDFEFYSTLTHGLFYDKEGNAMSEENPNGKWQKYNLGANFSYPFKLVDGSEKYQALASDVDWGSMHFNPKAVNYFETVWRVVVDGEQTNNDEEEKLRTMWENKRNYLSTFKDMDAFIAHNCAYWCYAYLDKDGWVDYDTDNNQSWVTAFYDRFVRKLNGDELITIFEFSRREEEN